jgi:hypothetical protein
MVLNVLLIIQALVQNQALEQERELTQALVLVQGLMRVLAPVQEQIWEQEPAQALIQQVLELAQALVLALIV